MAENTNAPTVDAGGGDRGDRHGEFVGRLAGVGGVAGQALAQSRRVRGGLGGAAAGPVGGLPARDAAVAGRAAGACCLTWTDEFSAPAEVSTVESMEVPCGPLTGCSSTQTVPW